MPKAFTDCIKSGGRVKTVSGPNRLLGVKKGQYRHVCFLGGKSFMGEVKTKQEGKG